MTIDSEFKRSSNEWRKLVTIRTKVPGIELNVDYDKINPNEVEVKNNFVVIHSQEIVDQIIEQNGN